MLSNHVNYKCSTSLTFGFRKPVFYSNGSFKNCNKNWYAFENYANILRKNVIKQIFLLFIKFHWKKVI